MFFKNLFLFLQIYFISFSSLLISSNAYTVEELTEGVNNVLINHLGSYEAHVMNLLKIDPNYFNYQSKYKFECKTTENNRDQVPESVHRLKPSDIKVVGALGDSLTAAVGVKARTPVGILIENREVSWSIGGQGDLEEVVTLPNILKKYNPNLFGYSTRPSFVLTSRKGKGLNAAVSGQKANHMLEQARVLIQRMKESEEIDFERDWKLVTLFIGGNDLCQFCKDLNFHSPQAYIENIEGALDLMQKELPRTLVNLVNALNVEEIRELNVGLACTLLHKYECPCGAYPKGNDSIVLEEFFKQYSNYTEQLAQSGKYDVNDEFTVVYQPFFRDFKAPRLPDGTIDITYFAPDCFHFSAKSQGNLYKLV
jgi:phospholipase B1, membrane-associated